MYLLLFIFQEEQRLAEEARLRALEKNEKKMKSYRVDMGNRLETDNSAAPTAAQNEGTQHDFGRLPNASSNILGN